MRDLIFLFLRLGVTALGGPAAHIGMFHDEVVKRRGWMSEQHFLDLVGATNLIPGPNSSSVSACWLLGITWPSTATAMPRGVAAPSGRSSTSRSRTGGTTFYQPVTEAASVYGVTVF